MSSFPTFNPVKPRVRRKGREKIVPAAPAAPVLVAAVVGEGNDTITLTFDRAIDFSRYDGSTFFVNIPLSHAEYQPNMETVRIDPATLQAGLDYIGPSSGTQPRLTASAPTGIVAVDGGIAWGGCVDLTLPFG